MTCSSSEAIMDWMPWARQAEVAWASCAAPLAARMHHGCPRMAPLHMAHMAANPPQKKDRTTQPDRKFELTCPCATPSVMRRRQGGDKEREAAVTQGLLTRALRME